MSKHTPGPWSSPIHEAPNGDLKSSLVSVSIQTPRGAMSLSCHGIPRPGEMQANAALITAAPRYHEACTAGEDTDGTSALAWLASLVDDAETPERLVTASAEDPDSYYEAVRIAKKLVGELREAMKQADSS